MKRLRLFATVAFAACGLAAHADLVLIDGFDMPFYSDPISTGTAVGGNFENGFDDYFEATVVSNTDTSGVERLLLHNDASALKYSSDSGVQGLLKLSLIKRIQSGPNGYLGYDLGNMLTAVHLDFGSLDHDVAISFTGNGQNGRLDQTARTFSGGQLVAAGSTSVDIPLSQSSGPLTRLSRLDIVFDAPAGTDFHLEGVSVQAVPEPASLCSLGIGAVGMIRRRARKRPR